MPVITGSRGGGSTSPYLTLQWDVIETDIANNRSKVRLILKLVADYDLQFSARKSGKLQGSSFTYTGGARGTGSWTLRTTEVWVSHNSDGTKTQNFSGSLNLAVTYSGTWVGNMTVSGNVTLPAIPRQSLLNSASITNLKNGSASTLSIGRTVYHSGFYHLLSIYDGNTWIWDTGYFSGSPATSYTIPSATVDKMLNRMPTATSKTFTVRLRTYTGSGGKGLIGTQSKNMSVVVDSTVKPTASGLSISQEGNSVSSHYLQSVSRVKAEFSASAGYGASVSTQTIIVRKVGGSNAQTISGASGTTANPIASTGSYEVVATARDSRGRTSAVLRTTFTATAYNQPTISEFTVTRQDNAQAVVDISRAGNWTSLGGSNVLDISVERRQGSGTWASVETDTGTATSGSFSRAFTESGNNVSLSYDYRLVISDKFGNSAESIASISTQRVVLDIHKNEGVGIGKVRERGVLDVDGEAYIRGILTAEVDAEGSALRVQSDLPNGHGYVGYHASNGTRKAFTGFGATNNNDFVINNEHTDGTIRFLSGTGRIRVGWDDVVGYGSNENGYWVRFYDGTQICWFNDLTPTNSINLTAGSLFRSGNITWEYPNAFTSNVTTFGMAKLWSVWATAGVQTGTAGIFIQWSYASRACVPMNVMAIGRWK